jgi:hypothetical protein
LPWYHSSFSFQLYYIHKIIFKKNNFLSFIFGNTGIWTQGCTWQLLYQWSHFPSSFYFCFSYFVNCVSHYCLWWHGLWSSYICLLHNWDDRPSTLVEMGVEWILCLGCLWTTILLISLSYAVGMCHHVPAKNL